MIEIDELVTMTGAESYAIRFRTGIAVEDTVGVSTVRNIVTVAGETEILTVSGSGAMPAVGDLVLFGAAATESFRLVVTSIEATDDQCTIIRAVEAAPIVDTLTDALVIPAWSSRVGAEIDDNLIEPSAPRFVQIKSGATGTGAANRIDYLIAPGSGVVRTARYKVEHRPGTSGPWTVITRSVAAGGGSITDYIAGNTVQLRARAVSSTGVDGPYTPAITIVVGAGDAAIPAALDDDAVTVTTLLGGALVQVATGSDGSAVARTEDTNLSVIGDHYAVGVGTYRFRSGGAESYATGVRIPYIRRPGGGDFTISLKAVTSGETATLTVDCNGTLSAQVAELTLPGEVTGLIPSQRMQIDVEVLNTGSGSAVEILPWVDTLDSTLNFTKLHYNSGMAQGGHNFDPSLFAAYPEVLVKQIADQNPQLMVVQVYDQVEQSRGLWELLLPEFRNRGVVSDILFVATTPVFKAGEAYGDGYTIDGVEVSRRELVRTYYRALCELQPECHFVDLGAIVRDQEWSVAIGYNVEGDRVHPTIGGAALIGSQIAKAIGNFRESAGPSYLPAIITPSVAIGSPGGRGPDNRQVTNSLSFAAGGDMRIGYWRAFELYAYNSGSAVRKLKAEAAYVAPGADNTQSCGLGSLRYSTVYAATGTINTSDERSKDQIGSIPDAWLDAWGEVEWVRYKWSDAVQAKGDGARWHTGLIAQRVIAVFAAHGIDALEIGLACYDNWPDEIDDETGDIITQAGNRFGIRYEEAFALEAAWTRRQLSRLGAA